MTKKGALCVLAACLLLCLSGCSPFVSFGTKNLMSPPKPNADQRAIHQLLQGNQSDITFIYPKAGEYRSAIIMHDFTGDGMEDAIGFHALEEPGGVEVQFLIKGQNGWETAAAFRNSALQVDRVCFCDLNGTGVPSVLIGWGSTAGASGRTASVSAYLYDPISSVQEYSLGPYSEMTVTDLDGDGISEVFTVDKFIPAESEEDEPSPATAKVFGWKDNSMTELSSAEADNSIANYTSAAFGKLSHILNGVILDGAKADGSLSTQIFYLEGGRLVNFPSGVNAEGYLNPFARPSAASFLCRDINGDSVLEIPEASLLPCIPEETVPDSTGFLVEWCAFRPGEDPSVRVNMLANTVENYWFRVPYMLLGRITSSNDSDRRTVTYTEVITSGETGESLLGSPLFSIRVFTPSAWESRGETSGYQMLLSREDAVYGIQILTKDEGMAPYIEQIKRSFRLLNE